MFALAVCGFVLAAGSLLPFRKTDEGVIASEFRERGAERYS